MQKPDTYLIGAILLVLGAVEIISLVLVGATTDAVAAWVQAFGVIGALFVAIFIPLKTEQDRVAKEAEERGEKTFSVASSLTGAIWLLDVDVNRVLRKVAQAQAQPPTEAFWQDWVKGLVLPIPPALISAVPLMHGLQENIIGPFRTAAMLAETFNGYTERWAKLEYAGIAQNWPVMHKQISAQIVLLRRTIQSVQAQFPGQSERAERN